MRHRPFTRLAVMTRGANVPSKRAHSRRGETIETLASAIPARREKGRATRFKIKRTMNATSTRTIADAHAHAHAHAIMAGASRGTGARFAMPRLAMSMTTDATGRNHSANSMAGSPRLMGGLWMSRHRRRDITGSMSAPLVFFGRSPGWRCLRIRSARVRVIAPRPFTGDGGECRVVAPADLHCRDRA